MALTIRTKDGNAPLRDRIQQAIASSECTARPATTEFIDNVWPNLQPLYKDFTRRLHKYVLYKLAEQNLACTITSRVKSLASTAKTLTRREASSKRKGRTTCFTMADIFAEMHDLAGLRIVVQLPGDMEAVQKFVQETFVAQKPPNVFVTDRKAKDRAWHTWFGAYKTSNYRVSYEEEVAQQTAVAISSSRGRILTSQDAGVMFEVQVVSLADSLYGALAHDLLYKEYAGPLSKQDQVVLDLSHGASMCYGLATKYFEEKIKMVQAQTKEALETASPISPTATGFPPRLPFANSGRRLYRRSTTQLTLDKTPSFQHALSFPKGMSSSTGTFHLQMMKSMRDTVEKLQSLGNEQLVVSHKQDQQDHQDQRLQDLEDNCLQALRNVDKEQSYGYEWYKNQTPKRVQGTCSWFLENDAFHAWLKQGPSNVLLVTTDPKGGKTVLARHLIEAYLPGINADATFCYFFFQSPDQVSIDQALCAILHQLLSSRRDLLRTHALEAFHSNGPRLAHLTSVLWTILGSIGRDTNMCPLFIVVDGVDECSPVDLKELVAGLATITQDSNCSHIKVLLTGRPYRRVTEAIRRIGAPLHIRGEKQSDTISRDVDLVTQTRVDDLAEERGLSSALADHIRSLLNKTEHHTYFWTHMALDLLTTQHFPRTKRGIDTLLQSIPYICAGLFESILSNVQDRDMARCVFGLLLTAERPLTVSEMNTAVHIILARSDGRTGKSVESPDLELPEDFEITLRDCCGLFVTIRGGHIDFIHPTAREFLMKDGRVPSSALLSSSLWHQTFSMEEAHGMATQACAGFLDIYFSSKGPDDFLDYALTFGQLHAGKGTAVAVVPQIRGYDALLLKKRKRENEWKLDWQTINRQWSM